MSHGVRVAPRLVRGRSGWSRDWGCVSLLERIRLRTRIPRLLSVEIRINGGRGGRRSVVRVRGLGELHVLHVLHLMVVSIVGSRRRVDGRLRGRGDGGRGGVVHGCVQLYCS